MLQDIYPHQFNNEFSSKKPTDADFVIVFDDDKVLMNDIEDGLSFLTVKQLRDFRAGVIDDSVYLFSLDGVAVFGTFSPLSEGGSLKYFKVAELREILPEWMVFVVATATHLANWYVTNKFCGKCASPMVLSKKERALCCENCGLTKYPNISPAVIVGITNGDKILLTRYSDRPYKKYSLVAGFMEIGETLEDTIRREVMEEVGLTVKNICYYKSQPWAFSQSVLMGFFAELDGSDCVKVDKSELSEATWFLRDYVPPCDTMLSLTNEMIETFRKNELKPFYSVKY